MVASSPTLPTLDGYQLRLPTFEGPLDVLLRLIERDQLSISDISLLSVFDQFIAHIDALESSPSEVIAEFAAVAGRLSVLKSRALLPRPPKPTDEPDALDLVQQLEEYRAVKAAAELLACRQRDGSGAFSRGEGVASPPAEPVRFTPQPPSALANAVGRWLTRIPSKPIGVPTFRVVSLREMIVRIMSALERDRHTTFDHIRGACGDRQGTAVAFLALLTLMRRQIVVVTQTELFGSITVSRREIASIPGLPASFESHQSNGREHTV